MVKNCETCKYDIKLLKSLNVQSICGKGYLDGIEELEEDYWDEWEDCPEYERIND